MGLPIIGDIIDSVTKIVSKSVVDKDAVRQIELQLEVLKDGAQARLDAQVAAQIGVNQTEAASRSLFVSGWRPAIGWVGAMALFYSFLIQPFLGIWIEKIPAIQYDYIMQIVFAMLGIGGMRTFEKVKGVAAVNMKEAPSAANPVTLPEAPAPSVTESVTPSPDAELQPKKKKHFHIF